MNESFENERSEYDKTWFRERAFSQIRRINNNEWDYSDSLLLYLPGHDAVYEEVQDTDSPYHEIVTAPERHYLQSVAPRIAEILPLDFEYIDLGPGTEHKEQFIFDELKKQGKSFDYLPVDISERYLSLSERHAKEQGIEVHPIRSAFEELPELLDNNRQSRFVSLGLTYCNYNSENILRLLKAICGTNGNIFVNSQIRDRIDMVKLRSIYQAVAIGMVSPKLGLLGLEPGKDVSDAEVTEEIKIWYTIKNINTALEEKDIKPGDRILVFQSLRPTLDDLQRAISAEFDDYELLDTGESFVGVVTK